MICLVRSRCVILGIRAQPPNNWVHVLGINHSEVELDRIRTAPTFGGQTNYHPLAVHIVTVSTLVSTSNVSYIFDQGYMVGNTSTV